MGTRQEHRGVGTVCQRVSHISSGNSFCSASSENSNISSSQRKTKSRLLDVRGKYPVIGWQLPHRLKAGRARVTGLVTQLSGVKIPKSKRLRVGRDMENKKQTKREKVKQDGAWGEREGQNHQADFCFCSRPASPLLCTGNGSLQSEGEEEYGGSKQLYPPWANSGWGHGLRGQEGVGRRAGFGKNSRLLHLYQLR